MFSSLYNYFYPPSEEPSDKQKMFRHLVMTQIRNIPNIQGSLNKPYDPELERLTAHSKIPTSSKKRKRNKN